VRRNIIVVHICYNSTSYFTECSIKRYKTSTTYFIFDVAVWRYRIAVVRLGVAERRNIIVVNIDIAKRSESIAAVRLQNAVERHIRLVLLFILDVTVWRYRIAVVKLRVAERRNIIVVNIYIAKRRESIAADRWENA